MFPFIGLDRQRGQTELYPRKLKEAKYQEKEDVKRGASKGKTGRAAAAGGDDGAQVDRRKRRRRPIHLTRKTAWIIKTNGRTSFFATPPFLPYELRPISSLSKGFKIIQGRWVVLGIDSV